MSMEPSVLEDGALAGQLAEAAAATATGRSESCAATRVTEDEAHDFGDPEELLPGPLV
jgi:hypothetical protein